METIFRKVWNDPVGSKLISSGIITLVSIVLIGIVPNYRESFMRLLQIDISLRLGWILVAAVGAAIFGAIIWYRRRAQRRPAKGSLGATSSEEWFSEIVKQIEDCNYARIYLRDFTHPDHFRVEHRDTLLAFMNSLAARLRSGADIEVVAYHRDTQKSGLDWLRSELNENQLALKRIKLINSQPVSNGSSMYLFDSGVLLYNRRLHEKHSYHIENLGGSIVHYLLKQGFNATKDDLACNPS